jgi:hypothetical protein
MRDRRIERKRVKHCARVGENKNKKGRRGIERGDGLKCFLRFLLICDVPPSETTLRNENKKPELKERKNLNERPSCKVKLQNQ